MSKSKRKASPSPSKPPVAPKPAVPAPPALFPWVLAVVAFTALVFSPMLANGFTNWDDQFYILENGLLRGPDWAGIFSQPVVSNYHPLTVGSLALNYQLSELSPVGYHLTNWLLHLANTGLVFYLAYRLSGQQRWVAVLTALFFGIHPMHVESVAWASERKDVLYTLFFLLALLRYLRFLDSRSGRDYALVLLFFGLSLLSKPAAVTFPGVLLLIDWYRGRALKSRQVWLEKLPFFVLALIFGVVALQIQAEKAVAKADYHPLWQQVVFAGYGFGEYIKRLFWPFPLSAIHPFPDYGEVPPSFYAGLVVTALTLLAAWFFRAKRYVWFGLGFYAVNVALVLQLLPFGNSIISERYTYVPYIGLVFAGAMAWADSKWSAPAKNAVFGLFLLMAAGFAAASFRQTKVWKDSQTLWTKAIAAYPDSWVARSNRGQDLLARFNRYNEALADYNVALQVMPDDSLSLCNRAIIQLHLKQDPAAYADADRVVTLYPQYNRGYLLRAFAADRMGKTEQANADYAKCIEIDPNNDEPYGNRGVIHYNKRQDYAAAKADFDQAIRLNPRKAVYYINRARCWGRFGNKAEALRDLETAEKLGEKADENLRRFIDSLQ